MKKKQRKKIRQILISLFILTLLGILSIFFYKQYKPTIFFDAKNLTGPVTSGASGYLYGLSEEGVPSSNMTESLNISSVSAKIKDGKQHPIGDVSHIAPQLEKNGNLDYVVVYLQDIYSTWYYDHQNITELKSSGQYNYIQYLNENFLPKIKKPIEDMLKEDYADKLVFCLFNECDNGIWFGHWDAETNWHIFDETDYNTFNIAWKMTYDYVKELAPDTLIGGPGNFEYNHGKIDSFLKYASDNNCVPDVMIYHELNNRSVYDWQSNVDDLHKLEDKYNISTDTPIIVTEYGRMKDNGNPGRMAGYIARIENSKVYANQAYWLMANNLCSTCADYNTPNSAWWLYRWYANLEGQTMTTYVSDFFHADVKRAIEERRELKYKKFLGVGTVSDDKDTIQIIVSGANYSGNIELFNLANTKLYNNNVEIKISRINFQSITSPVYLPELVSLKTERCKNNLHIDMKNMSRSAAYYIEITPTEDNNDTDYTNDNLFIRYEFENGNLLGNAYTYESAYSATGSGNNMVGGIEKENDGVELTIELVEDANYELIYTYGKANDGTKPDDRITGKANLEITNSDIKKTIELPNTIKSEVTSTFRHYAMLESGKHTIRLTHNEGTFVLDSLLIRKAEDNFIYFDKDKTRENSFLVVSPADGYYKISLTNNKDVVVDGITAKLDTSNSANVFLRRGLNYIDTSATLISVEYTDIKTKTIKATEATLNDARTNNDCITGISSESGSAEFKVHAEEKGAYKLTISYSNNQEGGKHDYNVDLIEAYITISVNGNKQQNLFCRNTYSKENITTVTTNIDLEKGENTISFSNDGSISFEGEETFAPDIYDISINSITK